MNGSLNKNVIDVGPLSGQIIKIDFTILAEDNSGVCEVQSARVAP